MDVTGALADELREQGLVTRPATTQRWLTTRGHLNPVVLTHAPGHVIDALDGLHASLGGDRRALSSMPDTALRADLALSTGQHVAADDVAHFTRDRLLTFDHYPVATPIGFSLETYRQLIDAWRQRAAAAISRRWSPDFDFAGGRRARRAYDDALRDLLTQIFTGMPLARVVWPDHDPVRTAEQLGLRLATVA
jgi:hypothetical protein